MKNTLSIFVGLLILLLSVQKTLVFSFYELEKDYVISQLCINKDVPGSCCKGKCFIEKQTSEKEAEGIIINVLKNIKEDLFFSKTTTSQSTIVFTQKIHTIEHPILLSSYHNKLIKPPTFA